MDTSKLKYIDFPLRRDCFGCSPTNPISLKLEFYQHVDDGCLYSFFTPTKHHVSWGNIIHGGISATVLDEMSAWVVIMHQHQLCVTINMQLNYLLPLNAEQEYIICGFISEQKGKLLYVKSHIMDQSGKNYVESQAVMRTLTMKRAQSMQIMNDEDLQAFDVFLQSQKQ